MQLYIVERSYYLNLTNLRIGFSIASIFIAKSNLGTIKIGLCLFQQKNPESL